MRRRVFLRSAIAGLVLVGCGDYPVDLCELPSGCSPSDTAATNATLFQGTAQPGDTQWTLIRRLWPEYGEADMAFMVFDDSAGYMFPPEDTFDEVWNHTFAGGEDVLFVAAERT